MREQFSFDEIIEELQISKSSASNALKNLEIRGVIEYITLTGDRKRYFQIKKQDAIVIIEEHENKMIKIKNLFEQIIDLKSDKESKNSKFLTDITTMMEYTLETIDKTKQKFKKD